MLVMDDIIDFIVVDVNMEMVGNVLVLKGVEVIVVEVKCLFNGLGVYCMLDENGDVFYVGKVRSLKKCVISYICL